MSYGWLTESALIPKESKKIIIGNSSLLDLKVALVKKDINEPRKKKPSNIMDEKNKGV